MNRVHFRTGNVEVETPEWFFRQLNWVFMFTLDVCATRENCKVQPFITPEEDALSRDWSGHCWMNPPYGRQIPKWVQKAHEETAKGNAELVVGLLPARTDTRWWHRYVMRAREIVLLQGRLTFEGAAHAAPFPSCLAIWRAPQKHITTSSWPILNAMILKPGA